MAGNYVTQVATALSASFAVNQTGEITAGASACKLSGKLGANAVPGTMKISLATVGCGALPASSTLLATMDAD